MEMTDILHQRFNPRSSQIPPVRIRGFKRGDLSRLFSDLGLIKGAEIGVADGIHALEMCQTIAGLSLLCVDPYQEYYWKTRRDDHERCYRDAQEKLKPYKATFMRQRSEDAQREIPDLSLDFVYIDGDHSFDAVMLDLIFWSRKVKPGGIVAGHDAYRFRGAGVVDAVSVYTHCHGITEWFLCDEREQDYFWAKP